MKKIKVVVLMGGKSSEREISLISGNEVIKNLNKEKYEAVSVDFSGDCAWIDTIKPDVVFIVLHGKYGEDGQIQKEFEKRKIKFTGSSSEVCKLGMDKIAFKKFAKELEIIVPKDINKAPCVVKPCEDGSSFGISIVKDQDNLKKAIDFAKKYDDRVVIEEYIKGIEVSCGVIEDKGRVVALPLVEICPKNEFFDYESKYDEKLCDEIVPARISNEMSKKIQEISSLIFKKMRCRGFARLDFIIKNEIPYLLEINMIPGMTSKSLLPKEAVAVGINYPELLDKIIESAL
jgi:D-alanine-D-alanine ligase